MVGGKRVGTVDGVTTLTVGVAMCDSCLMLDVIRKLLHFRHPVTKTICRVFEAPEVAEGMMVGHNGEMLTKQSGRISP